jgi:hypothetical protein
MINYSRILIRDRKSLTCETRESGPNGMLFASDGSGLPFLQFMFPMKNGRLPVSGFFCAVDWRNLAKGIPSLEWLSVQEFGRVKN